MYLKLKKIKKTKSTLPIDIPCQLSREFAAELSTPVSNIINTSLLQHKYPSLWKHEWVTPAPKVRNPKLMKDLRKISCTSDFSKLYEGYLKEWILEDIQPNLDPSQYGNEAGSGTDHLLVAFVDKVLNSLTHLRVTLLSLPTWLTAAFDQQDLFIAIHCPITSQLPSRPKDQKMTVK